MDRYSLYTYSFHEREHIQLNCFRDGHVKVPFSTEDKNLWIDRLFGGKKADVRIQSLKKGGKGADKYPCTVLAHEERVVWLRMENEKIMRIYVKKQSMTSEPDPIDQQEWPTNPFSFVFIDCRKGKNLIAIRKDSDAWLSTDVEAKLLEESLNRMMEDLEYGFGISIQPETMSKDYWDYNQTLIKKNHKRVKKMTIYFKNGTIDPNIEDIFNRTPFLRRLLKETWSAQGGKIELNNPLGSEIVDRRKHDIYNIIKIITSNVSDPGFGLSLLYDDGMELTCGKDIRLEYPMNADMLDMLFSKDLFGEHKVSVWLDQAVEYIKKQKNETTAKTTRKRKTPKHLSETSATLNFL